MKVGKGFNGALTRPVLQHGFKLKWNGAYKVLEVNFFLHIKLM